MTAIINAIRHRRDDSRLRRAVEHLEARLLCDAGLEAFGTRRPPRPFWWLRD